jgi:hypothetical protein
VKHLGRCKILSMTQQCSERSLLARKVAESISAVYALKERKDAEKKGDASLLVLLDQASTTRRISELALSNHLNEHGCKPY